MKKKLFFCKQSESLNLFIHFKSSQSAVAEDFLYYFTVQFSHIYSVCVCVCVCVCVFVCVCVEDWGGGWGVSFPLFFFGCSVF